MRLGLLASTNSFKTVTWSPEDYATSGANYLEVPREFLTALPPADSPESNETPIICLTREKYKSASDTKSRYSVSLAIYYVTRQKDSNKSGMYYGAFWEGLEEKFFTQRRLPIVIESLKEMAARIRSEYIDGTTNFFSEKPFYKEVPHEIGSELKNIDPKFLHAIKFTECISPKDIDRTCVICCSKQSLIPEAIESVIDYKMLALYKRVYFVSAQIFNRFKRIQTSLESKNFEATTATNLTLLDFEDLKMVKNIYIDSLGSVEDVYNMFSKRLRQKDEAYQLLKNNQSLEIKNLSSGYDTKIRSLETSLDEALQASKSTIAPQDSTTGAAPEMSADFEAVSNQMPQSSEQNAIPQIIEAPTPTPTPAASAHAPAAPAPAATPVSSNHPLDEYLLKEYGVRPDDTPELFEQKFNDYSNRLVSNKDAVIDQLNGQISELSTKLADRESQILAFEHAQEPQKMGHSERRGFSVTTFLLMLMVVALVAYILINR